MTETLAEACRTAELPVLRDRYGLPGAYNPDELLYMEEGACRAHDPGLFDTNTNKNGHTAMRGWVTAGGRRVRKRAAVELAKDVCRACPVLGECRAYVTMYPQEEGVWAATIPEERRG